MLPARRDIGTALAIAEAKDTQLIVTLFIFGMVFGEMFFGPIPDAIGSKLAILIGLALFGGGVVVALPADSLAKVLVGRGTRGKVGSAWCMGRAWQVVLISVDVVERQ